MSKDIIIKADTSLHNEDWYLSLVDDCVAISTERKFNACMEAIQCNWELGQRISEENQRMNRAEIYGEKVIENLSIDLGKSTSHLWSCVKVYKELNVNTFDEVVSKLPEGKNVSWNMALTALGIKKDTKPLAERKSIKIDEALVVFKTWLVTNVTADEDELTKYISEFREALVIYKK